MKGATIRPLRVRRIIAANLSGAKTTTASLPTPDARTLARTFIDTAPYSVVACFVW